MDDLKQKDWGSILAKYLEAYPFYNDIVVGFAKELLNGNYQEALYFRTWFRENKDFKLVRDIVASKKEVIDLKQKEHDEKREQFTQTLSVNILLPKKAFEPSGLHVTRTS